MPRLEVLESFQLRSSTWLLSYCFQKDADALNSFFVTKVRSASAASFSQLLGKKGEICHLLGSEKTQQPFLLQTNLWRCIDMRLVCAAWWISRIAVIANPIQTPYSYSFFFLPPSTSNLSAIWSSHRLAARNKPGWWKQVDPGRGSVWKTTSKQGSSRVPVSFSSPGHAYYSLFTIPSL